MKVMIKLYGASTGGLEKRELVLDLREMRPLRMPSIICPCATDFTCTLLEMGCASTKTLR